MRIKKIYFQLIYILSVASFHLKANSILLTSIQQGNDHLEAVEKILISTFKIPKILIDKNFQNSTCTKDTSKILHLCFLPNGETRLAHFNNEIFDRSYKIFLR